jgi:hypothetical protein
MGDEIIILSIRLCGTCKNSFKYLKILRHGTFPDSWGRCSGKLNTYTPEVRSWNLCRTILRLHVVFPPWQICEWSISLSGFLYLKPSRGWANTILTAGGLRVGGLGLPESRAMSAGTVQIPADRGHWIPPTPAHILLPIYKSNPQPFTAIDYSRI